MNFFRNSACSSAQFLMVLGLNELSHILALSLRVNGNAFSLSKSMSIMPSLKVVQTSSKSLICVYGRRVDVVPHGSICSWIHGSSKLTMLFLR